MKYNEIMNNKNVIYVIMLHRVEKDNQSAYKVRHDLKAL